MKSIVVVLLLLWASVVTSFADSLVTDPMNTHIGIKYQIWQAAKGLSDLQVETSGTKVAEDDMEPDGSIKHNLDSLSTGTFHWYVRACQLGYIYGPANTQGGSPVCSVFVPFDFTKRSSVSDPITGLKLVP